MARVLGGVLIVLGIIVGAFALTPADAQDNTESRLSALETQVADLSTRVAALESTPGTTEGQKHTIAGSITLIDNAPLQQEIGNFCIGFQEFDDVNAGAKIVVSDEAGKVIATGELGFGKTVSYFEDEAQRGNDCTFLFEITDVPDVSFYTIQIAQREPAIYAHDELEAMSWTIDLNVRGKFS